MAENSPIVKIRDSVDLFLYDKYVLTAYFVNTRYRKSFKVNDNFLSLVELIDGKTSVDEICCRMSESHNVPEEESRHIIDSLLKHRIVTPCVKEQELLSDAEIKRYERQINYFSEFLDNEYEGIKAQKKLIDSKIAIFGIGAVGGDLALQLAMAGVNNFILYDYDVVDESDIARHMYFKREYVGKNKTFALREEILKINSGAKVSEINEKMLPNTDIKDIIAAASFVVNTLDEPYIGYTSSKISRICVALNKPHYIAGGFDAHLASTGEMVIPYKTPCVECYTKYFSETLKDWKPTKHPVKNRYMDIGGLAAMTLFSSSFAAIEIIKYLAGLMGKDYIYKTRGELLFESLELSYLDVSKNPDCPVCGGRKNES